MKRKLTYSLVLAIVMLLIAATALAITLLSPKEIVEQVAVPIAQGNDTDWRINTEFSPEELEAFIRAAHENGVDLDENDAIMIALRSGKGFDEEETIMQMCREAFGGIYDEWTIAERHWFCEMMVAIGYKDWGEEPLPGTDDLTEEDARTRLIAAIQETFNDEMYLSDYGEEMNLEDKTKFSLRLTYSEKAESNGTVWRLKAYPRDNERYDYYVATLDKAGNVLGVMSMTRRGPTQSRPVPTRDMQEMEQIAAEGIRLQTGKDIPLEDPDIYGPLSRFSANKSEKFP